MKFKTVFFLFLFFNIFYSSALSSMFLNRLKEKITKKEALLSQLKERVNLLKEKEKRLARIYIMLQFKERIWEKGKIPQTERSLIEESYKNRFYQFLKGWIFRKFELLRRQEKKIQNKIEKEEQSLLSLKEFYIRIKRHPDTVILDPLFLKVVNPGRYERRLYHLPKTVYSPIEGKVIFVEYQEGKVSLIVKNSKCQAKLLCLDKVRVNLGQNIELAEPVGRLTTSKDFQYEITCH